MHRLVPFGLVFLTAFGTPSFLGAANKTWTNISGGQFSAPLNWNGGVPGPNDTATFSASGGYTVIFANPLPNPVLNQDLFFSAGTVFFSSGVGGPFTYRLTGAGGDDAVITGGSLVLGASGPVHLIVDDDIRVRGNASLGAQSDSDITTVDLFLGDSVGPAGDGALNITTSGTSLTVNGTAQLGNGGETGTVNIVNSATADFNGVLGLADNVTALSTGVFNMESGSTVTTREIRIAPNAVNGQTGTFNVGNGAGTSTLTQDLNASLVVGGAVGPGPTPNSGTLNVNAGGVFNTGGGSGTVTVNPTGTINVAGTLNLNSDVTVTGGTIARTGSGVFNLPASRTLTARNNAQINLGGDTAIAGGTTWQVLTGADLFGSGALDIGQSIDPTTVIIEGTGSSLGTGATSTSEWGASGHAAVFLRSTAVGNVGSIDLARSGGFSGVIRIESGADLNTQNLRIADLGGATTNGLITVTGAGSTLDQAGASTLTLGHASEGIAEINVNTGGVFRTGTGTSIINRTGKLTIGDGSHEGTFSARGDIIINGGILEVAEDSAFILLGDNMSIENGGRATFMRTYGTNSAIYNITGTNSKLETIESGFIEGRFAIANNGQVNVTAGGRLIAGRSLDVGAVAGTLTVDGSGSSAVANSNVTSTWGGFGPATITFRNGATGTFGGLDLAADTEAGTRADVLIESGARLTTGSINVNTTGAPNPTGTSLTITGNGSSVTLAGAGALSVGHATTGVALVEVGTGGSLIVGTGGTTIYPTGSLNIVGGTAALKKLTMNGGKLTFQSGSLSYIGDLLVGEGGLLSSSTTDDVTLTNARHLTLTGRTTIDRPNTLRLEGGTLNTGSLDISGTFEFESGNLSVNPDEVVRLQPDGVIITERSINGRIDGLGGSEIHVEATAISLGRAVDLNGFNHQGLLDVGANSVTLNSAGYARLGALTALAGGTINAPNGVSFTSRSNLAGSGTINGRLVGEIGAVIQADGPLTLGNAASPAGYNFDGELRTRQHTVTLRSSARAGLGNLTTLGSGASAGTLNAASGYVVDFDEAVTGFGTINSDNTLAKQAIINGTVQGNSAAQPITITGYVKGVGSFDNVIFGGTFDPGLSPTLTTGGSMSFSATNTLIMELGGTTRGSQYDAILAKGNLGLDGTLNVAIINGFAPLAGNVFDIFDWATLTGTFDELLLPALAGGLAWDTSQLYTSGVLAVISVGLPGDYNNNGAVDAADFVVWRKNLGSGTSLPNDDTAGIGPDDYNRWRANFGRSAAGAAGFANANVPEPHSIVVVFAAAASLLASSRPHRASPDRVPAISSANHHTRF